MWKVLLTIAALIVQNEHDVAILERTIELLATEDD